ncbi:FadR family transcriptional regulator [Lysinibacillus yapensis]|uniref:FadR family transcriptional regulator n=1 Tax=Ureibacillus yapensis TaxID=2304605 RepID=A0A396SF26_9BACL|nr:FadR/GntR family transcriptional regulator [Lysinibacillus yapensis]RHW37458.1 FadR family transcriptional regulator [Lysinibacillus yapensis]
MYLYEKIEVRYMFSERTNIKLSSVIADELKNIIFENKYNRGDSFYSEREIVDKWSCSRATAREALLLLEFEGLITTKPGSRGGVFVREPNSKSLVRSFQTSISFNHVSHEDITEIRIEIESLCAKWASLRATEEDLNYISKVMGKLEKELTIKGSAVEENIEFHMAIANATHNQVVIMLMKTIESLVYEDSLRFEYTAKQKEEIINAHRKIFDAIANKNPEAAERRMRQHLEAYRRETSDKNRTF